MVLKQVKLNMQTSYSTAQVRAGTMTRLPKHKELIYKNIILFPLTPLFQGIFFLAAYAVKHIFKAVVSTEDEHCTGKTKTIFP